MSNHNGSYMLNRILFMLEDKGVFKDLGLEKSREIIKSVSDIGEGYGDCNPGEILENIGEKYGICYYCNEIKDNITNGLCEDCRY